jgi:hypothetical protein
MAEIEEEMAPRMHQVHQMNDNDLNLAGGAGGNEDDLEEEEQQFEIGAREKIELDAVLPSREIPETDELASMVKDASKANLCSQFFDLIGALSGAIVYQGEKCRLDDLHRKCYLNFCNFVQHEGLAIKNNGFGLFAGTRRYA